MFENIIDEKISEYIENVKEILNNLLDLSKLINNKDLINKFENYIEKKEYSFLLTVAGEVNAGKSSLINAILGENVLDVDVVPTTDKIYLIYYNHDKKIDIESKYFVKVGLNYPVLKNITIVDTPGTNSIIKKHQEITEEFIPASDLVFIVFSIDNIYTHSSWDFLKYVANNWKREIIVIINKIDKVDKEELNIHIKEVEKLINKAGLKSIIFPVSTKLYLNNEIKKSGFTELKQYIKDNLENKKKLRLKYKSMLNFSKKVFEMINYDYEILLKDFNIHNKQKQEIIKIIDKLETELENRIVELKNNIETYIVNEKKNLLDDFEEMFTHSEIASKSIVGFFNKNKKLKNRVKIFVSSFEEKVKNYIKNEITSFFKYFTNYYYVELKKLDKIVNNIEFAKEFKAMKPSLTSETFNKNELLEFFENFKNDFERLEAINYLSINERVENFSSMLYGGTAIAILSIVMIAVVPGLIALGSGLFFSFFGIFLASKGIKINRKKVSKKIDKQLKIFIEKTNNIIDNNLKKEFEKNIDILKTGFKDFFVIVDNEESKVNVLDSNISKIKKQLNRLF